MTKENQKQGKVNSFYAKCPVDKQRTHWQYSGTSQGVNGDVEFYKCDTCKMSFSRSLLEQWVKEQVEVKGRNL